MHGNRMWHPRPEARWGFVRVHAHVLQSHHQSDSRLDSVIHDWCCGMTTIGVCVRQSHNATGHHGLSPIDRYRYELPTVLNCRLSFRVPDREYMMVVKSIPPKSPAFAHHVEPVVVPRHFEDGEKRRFLYYDPISYSDMILDQR